MSRLGTYLSVGRSLATAAAVGRGHPGRLSRLTVPELPEVDPATAAALDDLLAGASIATVQAALAAGQTTSEALTIHLLARTAARDPGLNSMITAASGALAEARAADARRASGASGPLLGIPVTVKDNIESAGEPTTSGAEILAGHRAAVDAELVAALRRAGAVVLGKANLSELAGALCRSAGFSAVGGQTVNPAGRAFSPGGSSSGSAVGVAAGLTLASIGTETSGSLLAPAAFNGVAAFKPSRGLVASRGIVPLVSYQDTAGPVARSIADAGAVLAVLAGQPMSDALSDAALAGVRVGVLRADIEAQRSPFEDTADNVELLTRIDRALDVAGALVAAATVVGAKQHETGFLDVVLGGLTHDTIGYLREAGAPVATLADLHAYNLAQPRRRMPRGQFFASLALARGISAGRYQNCTLAHRRSARDILDAAFESAGVEMLISLSSLHSSLYATAGYPAASVPLGRRANGMPAGATLIGRAGADWALLNYAHAFELALRAGT